MRLGTLEAARRTLLLPGGLFYLAVPWPSALWRRSMPIWLYCLAQPCARRRRRRRPGRTALKAPLISTVRTVEISFLSLPQASSISCTRQVVRSAADRRGRGPELLRVQELVLNGSP